MIAAIVAAESEGDRDKPRRIGAIQARQPSKPRGGAARTIWHTAASATASRLRAAAPFPEQRQADDFRPLARTIAHRPPLNEPPLAREPATAKLQPLSLETDDIDQACAAEQSAIMQDFALRLVCARTPSERKAIKTARKSALAAAQIKAKLLKAARRAAVMAARQSRAPRRNRRSPPER